MKENVAAKQARRKLGKQKKEASERRHRAVGMKRKERIRA